MQVDCLVLNPVSVRKISVWTAKETPVSRQNKAYPFLVLVQQKISIHGLTNKDTIDNVPLNLSSSLLCFGSNKNKF